MRELYLAIWRASAGRQIVLILLSLAIAALAAAPLSYQKEIINALTDGSATRADVIYLCTGMMVVILLSLALKWLVGFRASTLGEDMIRLMRKAILDAFTKDGAKSSRSGEAAAMITAESEELGKFAGSAFSEPVVQIGTLISVIGFIAATQPKLGIIAVLIILPQIVVVLYTQIHVNRLISQRVRVLRQASAQVAGGEVVKLQQDIDAMFDSIYETRRRIFHWKLSTKFFLSTVNGAGAVAVLMLGGALVLRGQTDVGTVVAATMGLGRLQAPTAFLIAFYRQVSATRVKYELLRSAFPDARDAENINV